MTERDLTAQQRMISSCTGAVFTSLLMTPFDVVKVRLQAQQKAFLKHKCYLYCNGLMEHVCYLRKGDQQWFDRPGRYRGTWDAFTKISRVEGLQALWSGLPPTLVMAVPSTVLYFTSYDLIKQNLEAVRYSTPVQAAFISGATARTLTCVAISPLELVRTKMQSQKLSYADIARTISTMVREQGVRSLYMGLASTLLRDVPFSCIYWSTYEFMKRSFNGDHPPLMFCLMAGATAGSTAAILTLPFDVIKTHRQLELGEAITQTRPKVKDPVTMLLNLYKQSGVSGLFTGLVPRLARVAPACAIMITTYEGFKAYFVRRMRDRQSDPLAARSCLEVSESMKNNIIDSSLSTKGGLNPQIRGPIVEAIHLGAGVVSATPAHDKV
ncbi:solute carrier family 25 member 40-like isoform X2 [Varroa jacobsoni]|uniref:Mitochondrial carrier protein n=1 Tax=Varroa destructor TaxID=109461 RepID=A0A7M7JP65_VARDE|nr:solute carrier family 25 member 40-like isoform X2 [Varroa destructor]XP_022697965.1 solute carrier family 25 member 40-like isoform X2 [Varroa jacobsoni]